MFPSDEELTTLRTFPEVESRVLEFKQTTDVPFTKFIPTVCAFLNVGGGQVIFGVRDNQDIVGLKTNEKRFDTFLLLLDNILHSNMIVSTAGEPLQPDALLTRCIPCWNGNKLLIVTIRGEEGKQYQLKDGSRFHRLNASNLRISGTTLYTESDVLLRIENAKQHVHEQYTGVLKKVQQQLLMTQERLLEMRRENEETLGLLHTKILQEKGGIALKRPGFLHYLTCGML